MEATAVKYPRLWLDVARTRGVQTLPDGSITAEAFADVGISILNGCPVCEATVAPYNSYQIDADDPYAYCEDCAGVTAMREDDDDEAYAFGGGAAADNHAEEAAERAEALSYGVKCERCGQWVTACTCKHASYGWIIDRETVTESGENGCQPDSRAGWVGPRDIAPEIERDLRNGQGLRFKMFDDDGELYYEGRYIGPTDDDTQFGPLNDLGTPDAGATRIDYLSEARLSETRTPEEREVWVTL